MASPVGDRPAGREGRAETVPPAAWSLVEQPVELVEPDAEGKLSRSKVTYGSEPGDLVAPRDNAVRTIMELHEGGALRLCRRG